MARAHSEADRIVAVKVLHTRFAEDETFQIRLRREAHTAAGLIEPRVVPIHHYGQIGGRLYVDMRLIEDGSLEALITDGPLGQARAVTVRRAGRLASQDGYTFKPESTDLGDGSFAFTVTGPGAPPPAKPLVPSNEDSVDGFDVSLDFTGTEATVTVRRNGEVVTIQPYLAAAGHLVDPA